MFGLASFFMLTKIFCVCYNLGMETLTLENQTLSSNEILTDDIIFGKTETKKAMDTSGFGDFTVIILLAKNPAFKGVLKPYEINIYGKKMWQWVALACEGYKTKTVACSPESNILSLIKPHLEDTKFTAVFYSDTPLLQKSTIEEIFMFARSRDINVMRLTRGFIFNTEYVKTATEIAAMQTEYFEEEDFITCYNQKQVAFVSDIIKNRILDFHMSEGVQIVDPNTTFVDCDCIIGAGTRIEPNNIIRGMTFIYPNCVLDGGNIIENSIIGANCKIINSYISESRIKDRQVVGPYEKIIKKST